MASRDLGSITAAGPVGDTKGWVQNLALDAELASDLDIPHPFRFWFRPEPIRENYSVNYNKMSPMGMSHGYHNYENTSNVPVEFELYVNRLMLRKEGLTRPVSNPEQSGQNSINQKSERSKAMSKEIEDGRRYLTALTVPPETPAGVIGGAPPACLVVIPGILSLRMRLINLSITFKEVDIRGNITAMSMKCSFEEAPLSRVTMQDVLTRGSQRSWGLS